MGQITTRGLYFPLVLFCFLNAIGTVEAKSKRVSTGEYTYGQAVPISCLSREIDTGEHVSDPSGKLQYAPFPTCNETSSPLSLRYGVSETINCTIASLPDTLYHLFEYYVHSDVPLHCRVPTYPLDTLPPPPERRRPEAAQQHDESETRKESQSTVVGSSATPFTPLTIALQGTLQLSHLHIWTDLNVLMHDSLLSSSKSSHKKKKKNKKKKKQKQSGQIVAGTAYSVPMLLTPTDNDDKHNHDHDDIARSAPYDPWKPGTGAKVVRGEPLTFTLRVGWVSHGDVLSLQDSRPSSSSGGSGDGMGWFTRICILFMAAGIGGMVALWLERYRGVRGGNGRWKGDGLLGHVGGAVGSSSGGVRGFFGGQTGGVVSFGEKGRVNGYGGYGAYGNGNGNGNGNGGIGPGNGGAGAGGGGYGGYAVSGKKD